MELQMKRKNQKIEKEYKENGIKITRYETIKPKPVPMKRVYRKPGK